MTKEVPSRRRLFRAIAGQPADGKQSRTPRVPLEELVNSLEYEDQARRVLSEEVFATIAGSDRSAFDRLTFRPRMNVSTLEMDLSVELLGERLFTPILVGPVSEQARYHSGGELETLAGAAAAKTVTIVSDRSSIALEQIGEAASREGIRFWCAVTAEAEASERARAAARAGASAIFVTVRPAGIDWSLVDRLRDAADVPVVLKGILTSSDAVRAIELGLDGLVVSSYGGLPGGSRTAPIDELIAIAQAVGDRCPILVDGSFRRATDILDALILGARAVLLGRPIMWALSAYGAGGVKTLLQMLQSDLARCFAMLGAPNPGALTRNHIRIHRR